MQFGLLVLGTREEVQTAFDRVAGSAALANGSRDPAVEEFIQRRGQGNPYLALVREYVEQMRSSEARFEPGQSKRDQDGGPYLRLYVAGLKRAAGWLYVHSGTLKLHLVRDDVPTDREWTAVEDGDGGGHYRVVVKLKTAAAVEEAVALTRVISEAYIP